MARVRNSWTTTTLRTASGQAAVTRTLDGTDVRLVFLRLPTGSPGGRGIDHYECLSKLHAGTIPAVLAVDGTATYTSASLRATLTGLMTRFHPTVVRTLDYAGPYGDGDHPDHHNAAYYAYEAARRYAAPHRLQGFRGYPMTRLPANHSDADAARKLAIFLAYSAHDSHACQTPVACRQDRTYWPWMFRAYQVQGRPPQPSRSIGHAGWPGRPDPRRRTIPTSKPRLNQPRSPATGSAGAKVARIHPEMRPRVHCQTQVSSVFSDRTLAAPAATTAGGAARGRGRRALGRRRLQPRPWPRRRRRLVPVPTMPGAAAMIGL